MGEGKREMLQGPCLNIALYNKEAKHENHFAVMDEDDETFNTESSGSSLEDSASSNGSSFSSDLVDDASSSSSYSNGPLFELSELMAQLPIKRGLSNYYEGKSQSFTSLSIGRSIEDLPKKEAPYRRKMKACKSFGAGLDTHKLYALPKATISKKASRGSLASSSALLSKRGSFLGICRPPQIPAQKIS